MYLKNIYKNNCKKKKTSLLTERQFSKNRLLSFLSQSATLPILVQFILKQILGVYSSKIKWSVRPIQTLPVFFCAYEELTSSKHQCIHRD